MPNVQRFGSYFLLKKIATGGMAELYKARKSGEKGFEKLLAIKMILPHLSENDEFISMFIDEAKVAALLDHQNIVQIYDLGRIENAYCIVMEYVRGKDIKAVLSRGVKSRQRLSPEHACLITASVLAGLSYAHRKKDKGRELKIVHRDISPQNLLLSYEGEVKIVDFGIAKAATQSRDTKAGVLKGKTSYMSPEQAHGKALDQRSDIFSTGVVMYEMLAGRKLFEGDTDINTLDKVREAKVEPLPTEINKDVPRELEEILLKALARDPEKRYQTAAEMEEALQGFMRVSGYSTGSYSLSQYMYRLFRDDIEEELREEELWDSTVVSGPHHTQTMTTQVSGPAPKHSTARPRQREVFKKRMPLRDKLLIVLIILAAVGLVDLWERFHPAGDVPQQAQPAAQTEAPAVPVQDNPAPAPVPIPAPAATPPPVPAPAAAPAAAPEPETAPPPPQPPIKAAAFIDSEPAGAEVFIDGRSAGTTPLKVDGIEPEMPHTVRLVKEGYEPYETTVVAENGKPQNVAATLTQRYGSLSVDARPWAVVIVDGEEKGMTPLAGIRLSAGEHTLALGNPRLRLGKRMKVLIEPDKTTRIVIDLKRDPDVKELSR